MILRKEQVWVLLRLGMGWIFLWAFFDKLFGLSFATTPDKSWLAGGSPTYGFLKFATYGPLASFYHSLAGSVVVDWLFMLGLLGIGTALILGIVTRIASYAGIIMMILMWSALLPPKNNPFLDEHIIYALVLLSLSTVRAGQWFGLGKWWSKTRLVKKYPILE
ncbi:MAG: DoxX family membrane protein [Candidatus Aenigmatarchaeota archaeon]|nr:DoxX family membrane protein [Candidatus Aenigmarchaeota archaeon]